MDWEDVSTPDFEKHQTKVEDREYLAQYKKEGFGIWRLFIRETPDSALRFIYDGDSADDCKTYAEAYDNMNFGGAE